MNIIVIAPTIFAADRGTPMRIAGQVRALAISGHNVHILTYGLGSTPKDLRNVITVRRIPNFIPWKKTLTSGVSFYKAVADAFLFVLAIFSIKKTKIIHAHLHEGVLIAWLVSKVLFWKQIKIVGDFHGGFTIEMRYKINFFQNTLRYIESWIHTLPDIVLTSSFELAHYIEGDRSDEVTFVPDMATVEKKELGSLFNIPINKKIVVYTGAFQKEKGIDLVYDAMIKLQNKNIHWIIAGAPGQNLHIPKNILSENYTVVSPLHKKELAHILEIADVAIDPKPANSLQGSGKLVNYISAGIPTVAFLSETNAWYSGGDILLAVLPGEFIKNIEKALQQGFIEGEIVRKSSTGALLGSIYKELC